MTREERKAMNSLKERVSSGELSIRPADKGGKITVERAINVLTDGNNELNNSSVYEDIKVSRVKQTTRKLEEKLRKLENNGNITQRMRQYLMTKGGKPGSLKVNRKIHKSKNEHGAYPIRAYVAGMNTPTQEVAGLIEFELDEGIKKQASYVQDTADILRKLEREKEVNVGEFLFTIDIVKLYPSVPREKTRETMRQNLDLRSEQSIETEDLLEMSDIVLENNEIEFHGRLVRQIDGTAIGSKLGRNYASCYMGYWEEEVMKQAKRQINNKPTMWYRYIDDIIGRWNGTEKSFIKFTEICSGIEKRIQITYEIFRESITFLDIKITLDRNNIIQTDLYIKPTDNTNYLHRKSDHPEHVKNGIAKGQLRRMKRICASTESYERNVKRMKDKLIQKGYKENDITKEINNMAVMERSEALRKTEKKEAKNKLRLITTHSAYLPNIKTILTKNQHILKRGKLADIIEEVPLVSLRRGRNLNDILANAKVVNRDGISKSCEQRCKLCHYMVTTTHIYDKNNVQNRLLTQIDCQTVGVVYGMYCKICSKFIYVGMTGNSLRTRFYTHRHEEKTKQIDKPMMHFENKHGKGVEECMNIVGLEKCSGRDEQYRIIRERFWIDRLGALMYENKKW
jgi:hypothetical protein